MITRQEMDESLERMLTSIVSECTQLKGELLINLAGVEKRLNSGEASLQQQMDLIRSGAHALTRIDHWANDSDRRLAQLSDHLQSLDARLSRLEKP
jgi:Mg2+ and Co2+ transporter CorA